ncbi:hypothetical protein IP70_13460 [alpha proteobacterium AAP38]|nr:hypothetical protein IP70_13460 [alpha proteobacterium AAP38]
MSTQFHLVTGAAGFIGSHLVDRLLAQGHRVLGIDNMVRGVRRNVETALRHPGFTFIEARVDDAAAFIGLISDATGRLGPINMVWHMAANSDIAAGTDDANIDLRDTFLTSFAVLQAMRAASIPRIAFASSSAIYGDHGLRAIAEDDGPLLPISNYGAMKLASEAAISAAAESYLERAWIFRFPNVVGGRGTHGVIYDFLNKLEITPDRLEVLGNGLQRKPYLHVADLIDAMTFIVANGNAKVNYVNIGPEDQGVEVRFIAETVVAEAAPAATIQYGEGSRGWVGDVPRFYYSTEKLRRMGWRPSQDSAVAVTRAVGELFVERRQPAR